MTRKLTLLMALVLAILALPACGTKADQRQHVLDIISATQQLPAKFIYSDERPKTHVAVAGLVQDDFRFKARVQYDGQLGYDEIVSDDTLAVRFIDPRRLAALVDRNAIATADLKTDLPGIKVPDALLARRWVVDPTAAPALNETGTEDALGKDPALDAVTALNYVAQAVKQSFDVKKWSKDDLDPAYLAEEDPFTKPGQGSGVTRYDLVRAPLPPPGALGGAGQAATPQTSNFRKMAIYVKNGHVVKVDERIEVTGKALRRLVTYYRTFLKDQKTPQSVRDGYDKLVKNTPEKDLGPLLLATGNAYIVQSGASPVLIRNMRLDLPDLGGKVIVSLPSDAVVHGSLRFLISAQKPAGAGNGNGNGSGGSAGGTGATTTGSAGGSTGSGTGGPASGTGGSGTSSGGGTGGSGTTDTTTGSASGSGSASFSGSGTPTTPTSAP